MLEEAVRRVRASDVPWDELRATRGERRAADAYRSRVKNSAPRRWLYAAALAMLCGLCFVAVYPRLAPSRGVAILEKTEQGASTFQLLDGSRVLARADARLEFKQVEHRAVEVAQLEGHVRYEVSQQADRVFSVSVRGVVVRVIGTVFEVTVSPRQVEVVVARGRVEVRHRERSFFLANGERLSLDTQVSATPAQSALHPAAEGARPVETGPPAEQPSAPSASVAKAASAEELMEQADQSRGAGRAADAIAKLQELIQRFPSNPRVALAWFTVGRIESSRGQHLRAAQAFEKCVLLRPAGALGEDAVAEWARSLKRTGDTSGASQVAERYLRTYPEGIHRDTLRGMVLGRARAPAKEP